MDKFFVKTNKIIMRKRLIRIASLAAALILMAGTLLIGFGANVITATEDGYEWTLITCKDDLKKWEEGLALEGDQKYQTDTNWVRCLMIAPNRCKEDEYPGDRMYIDGYRSKSNGTYYLPMVKDNEYYDCAPWPSSSGIEVPEDGTKTFTTRNGLQTPFIKYRGWDSDNKCYKFSMRMAKNDRISKSIWIENVSWYGIAHAAAAYGEVRFCDVDNITEYEHGASCNSSQMTDMDFAFYDDMMKEDTIDSDYKKYSGMMFMFYNIDGAVDRLMCYNGGSYLGNEKWTHNNLYYSAFYLYLGKSCSVDTIITDVTGLDAGETVVWDDRTVGKKVTVTVPEGATLVIDGICYNDGTILVDGGTLIVKGVLDMDPISSEGTTPTYQDGGFVKVNNGGLVLIERSGALIQRNSSGRIEVNNNSTLIINGSMIIGSQLIVDNGSRVESDYGSFVGFGLSPYTKVNESMLSASNIKVFYDKYGSELFSTDSGMEYLQIRDGSAVYFKGGFYLDGSAFVYVEKDCTLQGQRSKNIGATMSSMVVE